MIVIYILGYFIIILISIYLILSLSGFLILKKGQQPFDYQVLENDGGKFIITDDSRKVEYFVWKHGSSIQGYNMHSWFRS